MQKKLLKVSKILRNLWRETINKHLHRTNFLCHLLCKNTHKNRHQKICSVSLALNDMNTHYFGLSVVLIMFATIFYDFYWRAKLRKFLKGSDLPVHFSIGRYNPKIDIKTAKKALLDNEIERPEYLSETVKSIEKGPYIAIVLILIMAIIIMAVA